MAGYHLDTIPKGQLGEYSKVIEEFVEFSDAVKQDCSIMAIIELSDLIGSLKFYFYQKERKDLWEALIAKLLQYNDKPLYVDFADLEENFILTLETKNISHWERLHCLVTEIDQYVRSYNLTIRDLVRMSYITERAFTSGQR